MPAFACHLTAIVSLSIIGAPSLPPESSQPAPPESGSSDRNPGRNPDPISLELRRDYWLLWPAHRKSRAVAGMTRPRDVAATGRLLSTPSLDLCLLPPFSPLQMLAARGWSHAHP